MLLKFGRSPELCSVANENVLVCLFPLIGLWLARWKGRENVERKFEVSALLEESVTSEHWQWQDLVLSDRYNVFDVVFMLILAFCESTIEVSRLAYIEPRSQPFLLFTDRKRLPRHGERVVLSGRLA